MPLKEAETLSLGLSVFEKAGCYACHQVDRWNDSPKPGPSLYHLASKTNKDWTYKWILEPRSFRHNTWMPHFFKKGNNSAPEDLKQTEQEVLAITEYLFSTATPYKTADVDYAGDQEKGRVLVTSLGCMGCHQIQPEPDPIYDPSVDAIRTEQGPNLIGLGSKVNRQWLLGWLKNPYSYHPDTKMPNLRLNDQEAADITAYLLADKNKMFDQLAVPTVNESIVDQISADFLSQLLRQDQVDQRLEDMEISEKLNYAGEKLIGNYGCYSCHNIAGFEDKKPIGTSLNIEGSKLISKLDFAFWHDEIPHTKWDWFYTKVDKPETFDLIPNDDDTYAVKELPSLDKSRMPHYGLTDKEIDALVTLIMGLVKDEIPESKLPEKTPAYLAVTKGERFIHTNNCLGCHKIDGEGGAIWTATAAWLGEVAVIGRYDGVGLGFRHTVPLPLPDARAAGVGQHPGAEGLEVGQQPVAFDGGPDLLGTGGDQQGRLGGQPLSYGVPGDAGCPGDVLVGRVGARADQTCADGHRPALPLGLGTQFGHRTGQVGGVGSVDVGRQGRQGELDDLVEKGPRVGFDLVVGPEVVGHGVRRVGHGLAACGLQVAGHRVVVGEQRGGCADLGAHVADGALACGREAAGTGTEVLHDGTRATVDGEDVGDLQDDVLGGGPAAQLAGQVDADEPGPAHVPREAGHHVDGLGATHADGHHGEAPGVRGVAVGADHHPAGEGVLLEHHLVDDPGAGLPEARAVAGADRGQEVVDLSVALDGREQVRPAVVAGLDEVVAVGGGRNPDLVEAGGHELKPGHLGCGVLHRHPVGTQVDV